MDFSYEVSRSLAACEGAVLVIDASQGVEAQTLANTYLALQNDLVLIPVINKIDLPQSEVDQTLDQMENIIGLKREDALPVSAKKGTGVDAVLEAIVDRIPPPKGDPDGPAQGPPLRLLVRLLPGRRRPRPDHRRRAPDRDKILLMAAGAEYEVEEVGYLTPKPVKADRLLAGEVGYVIAGIKKLQPRPDRATRSPSRTARPLKPCPGSRRPSPWSSAACSRPERAASRTCGTPWRSSG